MRFEWTCDSTVKSFFVLVKVMNCVVIKLGDCVWFLVKIQAGLFPVIEKKKIISRSIVRCSNQIFFL